MSCPDGSSWVPFVAMQTLLATDDRLTWLGAVDRRAVGHPAAVHPLRYRGSDEHLLDGGVTEVASIPAGVRLAFRTDSPAVELKLRSLSRPTKSGQSEFDRLDGPAVVDVMVAGQVVGTTRVSAEGVVAVETGLRELQELELWLPNKCPVAVESVSVVEGALLEPVASSRLKWIAHGSSITQSRFSASPASAWTAQVGRSLDLDLTNLGFAGECHLDQIVARTVAQLPADLITICAGINIHTSASMSLRSYRAALIGFIQTTREGHPDVPLVVCSPIASPDREQTPSHPRVVPGALRRRLVGLQTRLPTGALGPTLADLRNTTCEVVQTLIGAGDRHLHYTDGRELLSADEARHLVDGLHPDQLGEDLLASRVTEVLAGVLDRERTDQ